jgi:hypothetical protein
MRAMEPPPIISPEHLQRELDALMLNYQQLGFHSVRNGCGSVIGLLLFFNYWSFTASNPSGFHSIVMPAIASIGIVWLVRIAFWHLRDRKRRKTDLDSQLIALGPQLPYADRLNLRYEDRMRLHDRLFDSPPEVAGGIVRILEVAGNRESLKYLEGYTKYVRSRTNMPAELRKIVADSALSLEKKLERETDSVTLLRPTPDTGTSELLRPVFRSGGSDPDELLRAEPSETSQVKAD